MKSILITAGLIFLAALCNAVMDTIDHHFVTSYFATWGDWWAGGIAYSSTDWYWYKPFAHDAWHFFKQVMVLCFLCAVVKYHQRLWFCHRDSLSLSDEHAYKRVNIVFRTVCRVCYVQGNFFGAFFYYATVF